MELIRQIRKAHGWTQHELGIRAGCTNKHISRLENGLQKPSYRMLRALALALEISDAELLAAIPAEDAPLPPVKSAAGSSRGS